MRLRLTQKEKRHRRAEQRRQDSYENMDRALNAALARRGNETSKDRQRAFGRTSKRPAGHP
jgi:hypothetical protein